MRSERLLAALVGLAVALAAPSVHAFCRTTTAAPASGDQAFDCVASGQPLYHPSSCVTYHLADKATSGRETDPLETSLGLSDTLARVFATWTVSNDVCNGIAAIELVPIAAPIVGYTVGGANANMVGFVDGPWPHGGGETLALTTLTFKETTGEILDADIEINGQTKWTRFGDPLPTEGYDLDSAMLHETGHFLGLAHAQLPAAVMYPTYVPGAMHRTLEPDDKNAICTAYPNKQTRSTGGGLVPATACDLTTTITTPASCDPEIKHGCTMTPTSARSSAWTAAVLAAAAIGIALSRRRRLS